VVEDPCATLKYNNIKMNEEGQGCKVAWSLNLKLWNGSVATKIRIRRYGEEF